MLPCANDNWFKFSCEEPESIGAFANTFANKYKDALRAGSRKWS